VAHDERTGEQGEEGDGVQGGTHGGTTSVSGDRRGTLVQRTLCKLLIAKRCLQTFFCDWRRVAAPHQASRVIDATALKALAHPLRFRLLEALMEHGPSTASALGRLVGENSGATSYHLRQLAAHGFIVEAPELGSARERWWRAAPGGWTLEGYEMLERPDTRADAETLLDELRRRRLEQLGRWHAEASRWGTEWVEASIDATMRLRLSVEEMGRLRDELYAVLDRWEQEFGDRQQLDRPPEGTAQVNVNLDIFPLGEPVRPRPS
jgi:DNA-binding transcriptional ArsR family regulator